MNPLSYDHIKDVLAHAHELITPAELHGLLCGLICAGLKNLDPQATALMLHLSQPLENNEVNRTLSELFYATEHKICNFELDFALLLPDEDASLDTRAKEFGKWCEGFLSGIGLAAKSNTYHDQEEIDDIFSKLSEASKLQFHDIEYNEEDEIAFTEITEYVRMAVFTVYTSLVKQGNTSLTDDDFADPTLH